MNDSIRVEKYLLITFLSVLNYKKAHGRDIFVQLDDKEMSKLKLLNLLQCE